MTAGLLAAVWAVIVLVAGGARRSAPRWTALVHDESPSPSPPGSGRSRPWRRMPLVAAAIAGWALAGPVGSGAAVGAGALLHRTLQVRRAGRERALRTARLPDAIDLLVVAGSAGLTARGGLALVAERGPPALRPAFGDVTAQLAAGALLADALPRLIASVGQPAQGMVRAVLTAERDGVPIRSLLAHLADDARRQRRHELEAAIRRLPVRLTFPLACCSLPAFVLLTVVPLVVSGLQRLGPVAI